MRRACLGVTAAIALAAAATGWAAGGPYRPTLDPRSFAAPGKNALLSLTPGKQTVRKGLLNVGHRRVQHVRVYTVTDVVKKIDGVFATAVLDQDFDAGEVAEQAVDYLAADRLGNVWYFGSYTESYEGGRFVNQLDSWLAGVKGGQAGILVPAKPREGMRFFRDRIPGEDADIGRVVKVDASACVPYGCFKKVVVLEEPAGDEWKYYVAGVGGIWTRPMDRSDPAQETELLIDAKKLTAKGLAEISNEVLRLDRHARTTAPSVFGRSSAAARRR